MSSVGLSGLSNISTQALQTRYERALKQINKLIQINRQLKEAANQKEAQASDANAQIATLQQANAELDQENNILDSKYMELEGHCGELETYCKQLEEKLQLNQVDRQLFEEKLREHEAKFQEELQNEGMKFNELARQAEIIHQVYQQNLTVIQEHQEKIKALEAQVSSLQQTVERLQLEKQKKAFLAKQDNAQILKKNLEHANAAVQRLNKQCSKLRGRQLNLQLIEEKQKLERYLGISAVNDPRQRDAVKLLINQYHKKIFNLQTGKKQLQHKYKHLKTKLLSSSAQGYQVKIDKLERLTEKQQMEIARLIETYDREINYLFRENVKLKQGLLSLSQRYKQKGMDVEEMERVILELRLSTQKVSFENQSLKKFNNSLIQAKSTAFNDSNFLNNHSESFKIFQKQKSEERAARMRKDLIEQNQEAVTVDLLNVQLKIREKSKTADQVQGYQTQNNSTKGQKINDRDFNFIQSVNIINGYNVNLGENSHYVKK